MNELHARSGGRHAASALVLAALVLGWFAPILFTGRIFISDNYLGGFFFPFQLWSDLLYSGFPLYADLNFGNSYPVRMAFAALSGLIGQATAYNLFVMAAFFLAGLGCYRYVFELTRSFAAALVAGAAFAFCGFLQSHVGHETMTHSAAWLPWIIWSTHRVVERREWRDGAWLALFAAAMYLANHPQIFLQAALLAAMYAAWMGWRSPGRIRAAGVLAAACLACVAMVGWQLAGAGEYAALSHRVATARVVTMHGALPADQIAQVALPWLFGAPYPTPLAPYASFGYEMVMETAAFVAAPVLILAMVGVVARWPFAPTRFWIFAAVVFFLLALGPQTMLGQALFFTPGFRLFNIPGRNVLSMHLAFSVLCGLGVAALLARPSLPALRIATVAGLVPTFAAALSYPLVVAKATAAGVSLPPLLHNITVTVPLALAAITAVAVMLAYRLPRPAVVAALLALTVAGCAYFGWNAPWRIVSGPASAMLEETPVVRAFKELAALGSGRVLAADGWMAPLGIGPNQSMLAGLRSVSGYGPLIGLDYATMTQLTNAGWIRPAALDPNAAGLDILAARWIFPHARTAPTKPEAKDAVPWNQTPLDLAIGGSCGGAPIGSEARLVLPRRISIKSVAMVTTLGCGLSIPQGTVVAHAVLEGGDGRQQMTIPIRAGIETAEWSAACKAAPGAEPLHQPARAFDSTPLPAIAPGCEGHNYIADLPTGGFEADALRFEWLLPLTGHPKALLQIRRVTVAGSDPADTSALDRVDAVFADRTRWRRHRLASGHEVFENLRARPFAWLVPAARQVRDAVEAFHVVGTRRYPDGTAFDPATSAVTVDRSSLPATIDPTVGDAGKVEVTRWNSGDVEIGVEASRPSLLVVSQRFYPGWSATLDGAQARLLAVDGSVQGVEVPAGRHVVSLRFAPWYLPWLFLVAALALAGVAAILLRTSRFRVRRVERPSPGMQHHRAD